MCANAHEGKKRRTGDDASHPPIIDDEVSFVPSKGWVEMIMNSSIIFAPAGELVLEALKVLDKGGTLALAGIYMTPIPEMDYTKYLYHERTLRSVANATRQDGEELLKIAADIPIRTTTQLFPLEDANKVLQLLKASKIDGAAVLRISD